MTGDSTTIDNAFEPLAAAARGNPRALLMLAEQAQSRGVLDRAFELARDAAAIDPADEQVGAMAADIIARCIPGWHIKMVQDGPRNDAFQAAIERAVKPGVRILDIGSGTGLLAMMAARAGATNVHSCEMNPAMAALATDIVAANGHADAITIHSKSSTDLDADADLGGQADLIVSEILGNDLVCEFVLPTMRDAAARLAKPGAPIIPRSAQIIASLAWWDAMEIRRVGEVNGFDVSMLNRLRSKRFHIPTDDTSLALRGAENTLFDFDFSRIEAGFEQVEAELVSDGGKVNGVVQWFRMQLDADGVYETRPRSDFQSSWACVFFPFDAPIETAPGERIAIVATIQGNRLRLWRKGEAARLAGL